MAGEKKQDERDPQPQQPVELTDEALGHVSGGMHGGAFGGSVQKVSHGLSIEQDVTGNKAKTADKAASAMDAYIRG